MNTILTEEWVVDGDGGEHCLKTPIQKSPRGSDTLHSGVCGVTAYDLHHFFNTYQTIL